MEQWKPVVGFENRYEVSDQGNVRNTTTKQVLRPQARKHGYLAVWLYGKRGNKRAGKQYSVHRIVAEAFVKNPSGYTEVNHIDECKQNNAANNLEWCSRKHNVNYGTTQQRRAEKIRNGPRAKAIDQLDLNGNYIRSFPSAAEANRLYGFNRTCICNAIKGKQETANGFKWRFSIET